MEIIHGPTLFTDNDIYLFKEGTHLKLYDKLGSHKMSYKGSEGVYFALWAPNAKSVSVIGNFNNWNNKKHVLKPRWDSSGIFEGFIKDIKFGEVYKYHIVSNYNNQTSEKSDPYSFFNEHSPKTAYIVWDLNYSWNDQDWMRYRKKYNSLDAPFSIYEVHLGSWKKKDGRPYTYRELGDILVEYVKEMQFTFVEFMPIMEHPFNGSWGYQTTGYFSATSRFGTPQDLMYLIDRFHKNGIGVIFDWVPSHFPNDAHGLIYFDGTNLYEHSDPRKGFHPDWKSYIFNYGRLEVKEFLINSALFWFDKYHIDGLRIDAVASMLYLDYSRNDGEWIPNEKGGRENLDAIDFLRKLNEAIYTNFPDVQTFAEESTAWPMVSRPAYAGGLGFGMKWNMGWMHDVLEYFSIDPIFRKYHQDKLTFSLIYAFNENFLLSLSHDEVVHGKGSIFSKMPGDEWQKFANLRLLYGFMFTHPGKKLLFMGNEFGQKNEWHHDSEIQWELLKDPMHIGIKNWLIDLNKIYKSEKALFENDFEYLGFEWIDRGDYEKSILCYIRKATKGTSTIFAICNFTPVIRENYKVGLPFEGSWEKLLNGDDKKYGGSGYVNIKKITAEKIPYHGRPFSANITLPPLGILIFKHIG